jgi:hypothetical protein
MTIRKLRVIGKLVLFVAVAVGMLVTFVLVVNNTVDRFDCRRNWMSSGMSCRYDWWAGCQVEVAPGRFIPARNYRWEP